MIDQRMEIFQTDVFIMYHVTLCIYINYFLKSMSITTCAEGKSNRLVYQCVIQFKNFSFVKLFFRKVQVAKGNCISSSVAQVGAFMTD